jgi:hypothetical protein
MPTANPTAEKAPEPAVGKSNQTNMADRTPMYFMEAAARPTRFRRTLTLEMSVTLSACCWAGSEPRSAATSSHTPGSREARDSMSAMSHTHPI